MADNPNGQPEQQGPPPKMWAVILTGFIDGRGFPVMIQTSKGKVAPQIIKLCDTQQDAERMSTRLRNRHSKVKMFSDPDYSVTVPIYGIAETDLDRPKKRVGNPNAFGRGGPPADGESAEPGRKPGRARRR